MKQKQMEHVALQFNRKKRKLDVLLDDGKIKVFNSVAEAYSILKDFFINVKDNPDIFIVQLHYYMRSSSFFDFASFFPGLVRGTNETIFNHMHKVDYDFNVGSSLVSLPSLSHFEEIISDSKTPTGTLEKVKDILTDGEFAACVSCGTPCVRPPKNYVAGNITKKDLDNISEESMHCTMCAAQKLTAVLDVQNASGKISMLPQAARIKRLIAEGNYSNLTKGLQEVGNEFLSIKNFSSTKISTVKQVDTKKTPWLN
jgi:hypothetical protein